MTSISLVQFARLLESNSALGLAQKVGLTPPPPPISFRNLIDLAGRIIVPLAPVNLQPQNGTTGISNNPNLFFRDPGEGTPAAAFSFDFELTQNNVLVGSPPLTGPASTASPLAPLGVTWHFPLPPGEVSLRVRGRNRAGNGPFSTSTFTVSSHPPPPPPAKPTISVTSSGSGQSSVFVVSGSGFTPNHDVKIRVVDDALYENDFHQSADVSGHLNARLGVPCNSGLGLHFSATDGRPDPRDLTGVLFSNTFNIPCP
jgi:hypothetical protein